MKAIRELYYVISLTKGNISLSLYSPTTMEQQNYISNYTNHCKSEAAILILIGWILQHPMLPFGSFLGANTGSSTQVHVQSFLTFKRLRAQEFK